MSGTDEFFTADRTAAQPAAIEQPSGSYRDYLYDLADPVLARYRGQRYDDYAADRTAPSFVQDLLGSWERLYREPFRGVSTDGRVLPGLYPLAEGPLAEGPLAEGVLAGQVYSDPEPRLAAERVLGLLDPGERERFRYDIDAPQWRAWSNPEFVIHNVGLRLEDLAEAKVEAILELIRACLSPAGYQRVRELMSLNAFLGELVQLPTIMNERSYFAAMFGTPSGGAPWGWQLFGHHVAINFVVVGGRQVIAPLFLGAEPAGRDDGRPGVFDAREEIAIRLASSLTPAQREAAVVYQSVLDPAMPPDRVHPADERHVAGAFRDNRVVPYEGLRAGELDGGQRQLLRSIIEDFLLLLTEPQRRLSMADVDAQLRETRFAWYGATDGSQPFYLRVHSPVLLAEHDHHAGVWLANKLPARFHVHSTLRLPNGNDYGRAYLAASLNQGITGALRPAGWLCPGQ